MNDRDLWWKLSIVGALIALAYASITPIDQKLKYGIDLAGGYSLLYEIDDTGASVVEKQNLSERVMRVLRERVDPKGVFNLVWRPVGHNRLEIQMPRPSEEVVDARNKFKKAQDELQATIVKRSDLLRAFGKSGADREKAMGDLVRGVAKRTTLLESAAKDFDEHKRLEAEYQKRAKQIEGDNLSRADVEAAVKTPPATRAPAFDKLIRGIPQRRPALDDAAKAWDAVLAARPTTQPASPGAPIAPDAQKKYEEKVAAYDAAVQKVLDANVDPAKLTDGVTIDQVVAAEEKLDASIAAVLATNITLGRLQPILDAKPTDKKRAEELKKVTDEFPGLTTTIDALVAANDQVKKRVRGEGRLEDPADLQRLLKGAGVLEFRILAEVDPSNPTRYAKYRETLRNHGPRRSPGEENFQWFEIEDAKDFIHMENSPNWEELFEQQKEGLSAVVERFGDKYYVLSRIGENHALTHRAGEADWTLRNAYPDRDEYGKPSIAFELDERGGDKFAVLTRLNKGQQLCIFLDDLAISHATIQSVIRTQGRITGNFQLREVQDMVKKLEAGSLPRKLKDPPISVRAIGPSLGEANREAGLKSAQYGCIAVAVFMMGWYFYAGGVAVFAVFLNLLFTLAMMSYLGATLTMAGIAGLVLSIGMSVDSNVLINERIREELAKGTAMRMAIRLGYERAFTAILDSHISTMLTSLILYFLGSEEIKGFGLTLGVGVALNLFTAYFVTRMFFEMMTMFSVPGEVKRNPFLMSLGVAAFGGLLYAWGYYRNDETVRDQSVLIVFGRSLLYVAPGIIGLQLLMALGRMTHAAFQKGDKPRMPMLKMIGAPSVNWIGLRPVFYTLSVILVAGGLYLFAGLDKEELYDIEFLGGTAAQIDLKNPGSLNQTQIGERLAASGDRLKKYGESMKSATVTDSGGVFVISAPGVPAARLEPVLRVVLDEPENKRLSDVGAIQYSDPAAETMSVRTRSEAKVTLDDMKRLVTEGCAQRFERAGEALARAQVQAVEGVGGGGKVEDRSFEIVTLETSKDIVVAGIMDTMQEDLDIQPALTFKLVQNSQAENVPYFAVRSEDARSLGLPIESQELAGIDFTGWKGAVAMVLDRLNPPQPVSALKNRLRAMRLQPGFESHGWRESEVIGLATASPGSDRYSRVMVLVADENYPLEDERGGVSAAWTSELAESEVKLLQAALQRQTSLSQITQFDKQVSGDAKRDASIAIALSWLVMVIFLWFRFGNIRWGFAAVVALIHDVIVALGCIAICHYISDTAIGKALLLDKFRVDLALVAALMTVIGYSVNDKIVVFDRIRENRGRLDEVTPEIINVSMSQTLARTLLTGMTTFFTILIMYIFGGPGIHGLNFALFIGILAGTYSSYAVACQMLLTRKARLAAQRAG